MYLNKGEINGVRLLSRTTVQTIMAVGMQYLVALSVAVRPFMPGTSDKMRAMLNLEPIAEKGELQQALLIFQELKNNELLFKLDPETYTRCKKIIELF